MTNQQESEKSILLIDDLPAARRVTRRLLSKLGLTNIDEAETGNQAFELLSSKHTYQAVICDVNLGDMTAIDLLEKVKAHGKVTTKSFILITSDADREVIKKATEYSVSAFLLKPFSAELLKERLNEVSTQQ